MGPSLVPKREHRKEEGGGKGDGGRPGGIATALLTHGTQSCFALGAGRGSGLDDAGLTQATSRNAGEHQHHSTPRAAREGRSGAALSRTYSLCSAIVLVSATASRQDKERTNKEENASHGQRLCTRHHRQSLRVREQKPLSRKGFCGTIPTRSRKTRAQRRISLRRRPHIATIPRASRAVVGPRACVETINTRWSTALCWMPVRLGQTGKERE